MASTTALRRIKKEYGTLEKEPAPGAIVRPLETNFLHAHFLVSGHVFYDTPYEGGVYHGVLKFPPTYPLKPPTVILRTPSGRFQPNHKICCSMSDFHPESWNPSWSIRTILVGLISFMNSEELTTGGMAASTAVRTTLAQTSLKFCMEQDPLAKDLFGKELDELWKERTTALKDVDDDDDDDSWPPPRKAIVEVPPLVAVSSSKSTSTTTRSRRRGLASTKKKRHTIMNAQEEKEEEHPPSSSSPLPDSSVPPPPPLSGTKKNAIKNKKKREKEKRKKRSQKFLTTLHEQVPPFLQAMESRLKEIHDIDVSNYTADHVCWRTETMEEYTDLVEALKNSTTKDWTLLIESTIGGRSIATFRLTCSGIQVDDDTNNNKNHRIVDVIEIPAPKDGSPYKTGLEHVEFVIANNNNNTPNKDTTTTSSLLTPLNNEIHQNVLSEFVQQYPSCDWNLKAQGKDVNPDVSLKVELDEFGLCSVKFHLLPLAKVIEYEKQHNCPS